jgi:hypothetical protein
MVSLLGSTAGSQMWRTFETILEAPAKPAEIDSTWFS